MCMCVEGEERGGREREGTSSNYRHYYGNDTELVLTYHDAGRTEHRHFLHLLVRVQPAQENKHTISV